VWIIKVTDRDLIRINNSTRANKPCDPLPRQKNQATDRIRKLSCLAFGVSEHQEIFCAKFVCKFRPRFPVQIPQMSVHLVVTRRLGGNVRILHFPNAYIHCFIRRSLPSDQGSTATFAESLETGRRNHLEGNASRERRFACNVLKRFEAMEDRLSFTSIQKPHG